MGFFVQLMRSSQPEPLSKTGLCHGQILEWASFMHPTSSSQEVTITFLLTRARDARNLGDVWFLPYFYSCLCFLHSAYCSLANFSDPTVPWHATTHTTELLRPAASMFKAMFQIKPFAYSDDGM